MSLIAWAMKYWKLILISLYAWAILLFGLWVAVRVSQSYGVLPWLVLILFLGISFFVRIIRLR